MSPQRQPEPVSDLGLVLSARELLGDLKTLLQVLDGLSVVTQGVVDSAWGGEEGLG